jgi:site-specific recombinase XerD
MTTVLVPQRPDKWVSVDTDEQLIALFLRQKRSEHTRLTYAQTLAQFLQFTGGKSLSLITLDHLLEYADWLADNVYAKATQALKLASAQPEDYIFASRRAKRAGLAISRPIGCAMLMPATP